MRTQRVFSALLFLLVLSISFVPPAQAQTPNVTIKNEDGTVRLQSFYDGGLVVPGNYEGAEASGDSIPAAGAGTRMMWYPAKAALRAGHIDNFFGDGATEWDASNVGRTSAAFNYNTTASGPHSFAIGTKTTASSVGAVSMGFFTEAADTNAVAMGNFTTASAPRAVVTGNLSAASGTNSFATGLSTEAGGKNSFAAGFATEASGAGAFSTGFGTEASGVNSFATGGRTQAGGSLSAAMGNITTAATDNSLSIGRCNSSNTSSDGSLFVVGNGTRSGDSCGSRSDALRLDSDGNMTIAGNLTQGSDRRLKTDIEDLEAVLDDLQNIDPVRFRFENERDRPSGKQIGLVAQEVQSEFPELVREGPDGMLSVAYSKLTAVVLKGLQEQQTQIEEKESQLERQKEQIADLKAENKEIKNRLAALEEGRFSSLPASLVGPWALGLLLGLGVGAFLAYRWQR